MNEEFEAGAEVDEEGLGRIIESAQSVVNEQFQISERLDRKSQFQVGSAAAFFAVVQAVAINTITHGGFSDGWRTTIVIAAVPSALVTIGAFLAAAESWRTQPESDLPLEKIRAMIPARTAEKRLCNQRELANFYVTLAQTRRDGNIRRANSARRTASVAVLSVALTGLELVLVFIALRHNV